MPRKGSPKSVRPHQGKKTAKTGVPAWKKTTKY